MPFAEVMPEASISAITVEISAANARALAR
jgi:hypothetical protein